nr:ATP-binding protein [Luteimonas sp. MC1828]
MNVFYLFFADFLDKKVWVNVEPTRVQGLFDYDAIHACIYYLVDNAAKYCSPSTRLEVSVSVKDALVDISFEMESLFIPAGEQDIIFEEGISGSVASKKDLHGAGLGLFLAREMARLNGGRLNLLAGRVARGDYSRNTFVLTLPCA